VAAYATETLIGTFSVEVIPMRKTPDHIIAAAKRAAAKATGFSPEALASAYEAIGVKDERKASQRNAA
jgi:hypothetical protein